MARLAVLIVGKTNRVIKEAKMEAQKMKQTATAESFTTRPITGVFSDPDAAERAYDLLLGLGYGQSDISVVMSEETRKRFEPDNAIVSTHNESEVANLSGKVAGGMGASIGVGAISGLIAGAGISLVAPGFGLIVLGPLAGLGASLGAIVGALYGIPFGVTAEKEGTEVPSITATHDVDKYEPSIREGKILLSVQPNSPEDRERIQREWSRINASAMAR